MTGCGCGKEKADELERKTLIALLLINASMFVIEFIVGFFAQSTGLIADSLDMFADATVYGLSLFAVGKKLKHKITAAKMSGLLQIFLGFGVLIEVFRRLIYGSEPMSILIMAVGIFALMANLLCLALIQKHKDSGVHMRASWIFSTNDVIANLGVIISGLLVFLSGSRLPDLIIGFIIALIVIRGGVNILKDANNESAKNCA